MWCETITIRSFSLNHLNHNARCLMAMHWLKLLHSIDLLRSAADKFPLSVLNFQPTKRFSHFPLSELLFTSRSFVSRKQRAHKQRPEERDWSSQIRRKKEVNGTASEPNLDLTRCKNLWTFINLLFLQLFIICRAKYQFLWLAFMACEIRSPTLDDNFPINFHHHEFSSGVCIVPCVGK